MKTDVREVWVAGNQYRELNKGGVLIEYSEWMDHSKSHFALI